jgi:hypothetical protein
MLFLPLPETELPTKRPDGLSENLKTQIANVAVQ